MLATRALGRWPASTSGCCRRHTGQWRRAMARPAAADAASTAPSALPPTPPPLAFGFSAGGLLFPFFVGVAEGLRAEGLLTQSTPVAGASAGSLIAACCKSGLSSDEVMEGLLRLAVECKRLGTRHNLGPVLEKTLQDMLPDDVHERANAGHVHVAVTALPWQPVLVNRFESKDDLIQALLTSCHIPWYLDGRLITTFRGAPHFDGGLTAFLPTVPPPYETVGVCCFPAAQMGPLASRISIAPDTFEAWPHDMRTMLGWAFEPAPEATLLQLIDKGKEIGAGWAVARKKNELAAAPAVLPP